MNPHNHVPNFFALALISIHSNRLMIATNDMYNPTGCTDQNLFNSLAVVSGLIDNRPV
jgi:hypothetical protein